MKKVFGAVHKLKDFFVSFFSMHTLVKFALFKFLWVLVIQVLSSDKVSLLLFLHLSEQF